MTVTASDETGIEEIVATWKKPSENAGSDITITTWGQCGQATVSSSGGVVTCTASKVISDSNYSGVYEMSDVYLRAIPSHSQNFESKFYPNGGIDGHGRTGTINDYSHVENGHTVDMPSFTVE